MRYDNRDDQRIRDTFRTRICPRCRLRRAGGACEASCPLFLNLGRLREIALYRDPMLSSSAAALRQLDGELRGRARTSPLKRYGSEAIELIQRLREPERMERANRARERFGDLVRARGREMRGAGRRRAATGRRRL